MLIVAPATPHKASGNIFNTAKTYVGNEEKMRGDTIELYEISSHTQNGGDTQWK